MADFSKLNFFNRLDARARVLVLFLAVIGVFVLVYVTTKYLGGGAKTLGPSRVATTPAGLQSIPGGTGATAEYQRALNQANAQNAEAAKMTGSSAIPTQINTGSVGFGLGSCVICSDKSANVKNLLDQWIREGKIDPNTAQMLNDLAAKNASTDEYADALNQLVRQGKLTPEQARALLEEYKKQHSNAMLADSEKMMDDMIKSGQLPLEVANELLDAQRRGVSPEDYAAELQRVVKDGRLSPEAGQKLLKQYTDQRMKEALNKQLAMIDDMATSGAITPDVAKKMKGLTENNVSVDAYARELDAQVKQGKLTPAAASKILNAYKKLKAANGTLGVIDDLLQKAEQDAYQEVSDLLAAGKITPETAAQITSMIQNNVPLNDFKAAINNLVQDKKLTPEIAQLKIGDYVKVKQLREARQQLEDMQANNAKPSDYAEGLKRLVAAGVLTPDQAEQLLKSYQGLSAQPYTAPPSGEFGQMAQRVASGTSSVAGGEFANAQTQNVLETAQERQSRIDNMMNVMSGQATQLIASWSPPNMAHKEGSPSSMAKEGAAAAGQQAAGAGKEVAESTTTSAITGASLIKGGTIFFAVLDTAINSDYPDTPVMATIVEGKYKGAKMLGRIVTTKGVTGQMDRVSLNFTVMNDDSWPKSKSITAYGIDPDTARTAIASSVDYHYLMRFGAIMGTAFLQGYATSITNAGTSTTGIFGTSTTHPALAGSEKIWVGLGQVGQTLGAATQNYINRPPTVRVDSGVSLGILFMTDVT